MEGRPAAKGRGLPLEVSRCYQPSRVARDVLASAYEQIVASGRPPRPAWRRTAESALEKDVPQLKQILCRGG
jgi:hypothetical protein